MSEYLIASREDTEEKILSVFHVGDTGELVIPREVLRVSSLALLSLKKLSFGLINPSDPMYEIEPISSEFLESRLETFFSENYRGGVFIEESAPAQIREVLSSIESKHKVKLSAETVKFNGSSFDVVNTSSDYPGMYL